MHLPSILTIVILGSLASLVLAHPSNNQHLFTEPCAGNPSHSTPSHDLLSTLSYKVKDGATHFVDMTWHFECCPNKAYIIFEYAIIGQDQHCQQVIDVTDDWNNGNLNGHVYESPNCGMWADFDGSPTYPFGEGAVMTWSKGLNQDCGWVGSPGHTGYDFNNHVSTVEYYHHCSW